MNITIALALIVIGIVLLVMGLNSSDSIHNSFTRLFTGHVDDRTAWLIIGGSICALAGLGGLYRTKRD